MKNFDEQKELQEESLDQEYYVEPSRGTLVWDESSGIAEGTSSEETPPQSSPVEEQQTEQLDLSMLDLPAVEQKEEETKPDEAYTKFEADFEKYMGTPLKDAVALVAELRSFQAQQVVEKQKNELRAAWGVTGADFDARLTAVQERFKQYPPELQAKLDNTQGAELIWAKLQQEKGQQKNVPTLDKGSSKSASTANSKFMFSQAQIDKMSNEEYSKNQSRIAYAFANGLVKR